MPDGAFYAWADCTPLCAKLGVKDSWEFAVCTDGEGTPGYHAGRDFGTADTARYVRFSTANSMEQLQEAVRRMQKLFQ